MAEIILQGTVRGARRGRQRKRREDNTTPESGQDWTFQGQGAVEDMQTEMEAAGYEIIGGAPTTFQVKVQIDRNKLGWVNTI